jgi:hypothetical protein
LIKKDTEKNWIRPILGISKENGGIEISGKGKANILNEHFSTIGEKLANECMTTPIQNSATYIIQQLTKPYYPTIMNIDVSPDAIAQSLNKLKANKACGPDEVSPKLLKYVGDAILPLTSMYCISVTAHKVPDIWKKAKISAIYKKEDETDKNNYCPISLLPVPRKVMEACVAITLTSHLEQHNLHSRHQWAYKKYHSTEMLMVKMMEDWRRGLDNRQVCWCSMHRSQESV